jgi:Flp pilus assembly protein TadD
MKALARTACMLVLLAPAVALSAPTETQIKAIAAAASEYKIARTAIEREDWKGAIAALNTAAGYDPQDADIQNLLGYSYRRNGELDNAFKHYSKALDLNPRHLGAHEYVGRAYLLAGKPDEAKKHLDALEKYCFEKCPERESLKKAIAEWDPWKSANRGGRSY